MLNYNHRGILSLISNYAQIHSKLPYAEHVIINHSINQDTQKEIKVNIDYFHLISYGLLK